MQCRVTVSRNHPAAGCSVTQRPCRGQQSRGLNAWDLSLTSCCSHGVASVSSQMVITVPPGSDAGRSSWVHTGATLSTIGMGHLEHLITVCCGIITVCCCCLVTKLCLCLTVCDPLDCRPPSSSVQGISQARILEWVVISFSRGSSPPRDQTCISCVSRIGGQILYL